MATIVQYVLHDENDEPIGTGVWEQTEYEAAKLEAQREGAMLIALEYEYSDSSLVHNYLRIPDDCTGYVNGDVGGIQHADPCPVHKEAR